MSLAAKDRADAATIEPLGDAAWLVRFGDRIDGDLNRRVHLLARRLRDYGPPWLRDLVPAYASLAVFVAGDDNGENLAQAGHLIRRCIDDMPDIEAPRDAARIVEIPVRYGNEFGPDLDDVARACSLSPVQVIARHAAAEYRVAMLGFAPGFPYLLGLDPGLAVPRLAQPRRRVEAGSVAIGGAQTGIYPRPGPGGWRVIGRTAAQLFDPLREPPSLLQPGDRVRFVPVTEGA